MEAELYKQNPWWNALFEEKSYRREIYTEKILSALTSKEIIFLTGLRRVGKTTLLKQIISHLLKKTKPEDILFLNLDSFAFIDYSIHQLVEKYREIHKKSTSDVFYLFLDEITAKETFEQELKSFYDNESMKIICSSSIATLMRDKKAYLTGRTKTIEVMPLTFQEFLRFKEITIKKADRAKLEGYFKDYLKLGGIPHYVLTGDKEYINELILSIIYKDIIAYHKITNERVIKELFVLLCQRVGKPTSYNKLAHILNISVDSVKRYITYFEDAYLFYIVDRYSKSYNERIASPKKIYIGDIGIKNAITDFKDLGSAYENLVFLKIKQLQPSYYLENSIEIDFMTKDFVVEAKYNQKMEEKQRAVFDKIQVKKRVIANGVDFFT
ncbi:ATP-binding protein [Candidatus Woesearchaeota archaeon]|nr:ATP-binding protein [Candidatus Woesearchaeota archaeon]